MCRTTSWVSSWKLQGTKSNREIQYFTLGSFWKFSSTKSTKGYDLFFNVYFLKGWWQGRCFHLLVQLWQVWEDKNVTKFEIRKLWCWSWDELIYLQLQWVKGENWSPYCHCIHVSCFFFQKKRRVNKFIWIKHFFPGLQIDWIKLPMFTRQQ